MADINTPALGESVTEATVARWTKKVGEAVKKDEILVELETDKVSLEVASPADGVLSAIGAAEGATVVPGTVLGVVSEGATAAAAPAAPKKRVSPVQFFREVRAETRKITWTSRKETWITSVMVFIMVVMASLFFAAIDGGLGLATTQLLKLATAG